jgi:hypothetical protein
MPLSRLNRRRISVSEFSNPPPLSLVPRPTLGFTYSPLAFPTPVAALPYGCRLRSATFWRPSDARLS